jgi:hypothetical protein
MRHGGTVYPFEPSEARPSKPINADLYRDYGFEEHGFDERGSAKLRQAAEFSIFFMGVQYVALLCRGETKHSRCPMRRGPRLDGSRAKLACNQRSREPLR